MIRRHTLWALVCACVVPAIATAQDMPQTRDLEQVGLVTGWWARAIVDAHQDEIEYLRADEQVVLAQTRQGLFTAFRADTGRVMWSVLLGGPQHKAFPAAMNENEVVVALGLNMYSLDKKTGEQRWNLRLPGHPSCTPEIDTTQVYIGTTDGSVYAYNLRKINELFNDRKLPGYTHLAQVWRYKAPDTINSIFSNNLVVAFLTNRGALYGVDARERKLNYQHEVAGKTSTPLGRSSDSIFIPSDNGRMLGMSLSNGRVRWEFTAGADIPARPRVVGTHVYVAPTRSGLYSLDAENGYERWVQTRAQEFCAAGEDRVYAYDSLNNLLILDEQTGRIGGTLVMRQFPLHVANELTDRIFVASSTGVVACFHERGRAQPVYHRNPDRRPILPEMAPDEAAAAPATPAN